MDTDELYQWLINEYDDEEVFDVCRIQKTTNVSRRVLSNALYYLFKSGKIECVVPQYKRNPTQYKLKPIEECSNNEKESDYFFIDKEHEDWLFHVKQNRDQRLKRFELMARL